MEVPEWGTQVHGTVHPGSGVEETSISGRGGEGGHRQGFQCLWAPPVDGDLLPIPGEGDIGGRRQLDGGGTEFDKGEGGMEEDEKDLHQGVGRDASIRIFI